MSEWHVTPDYIVNNWTDELLDLMIVKLIERKKTESEAINKSVEGNIVSAEDLAAQSHGLIKVEKHGN